MQLIVLTPEKDTADEIVTVNALFNAGLNKLHLRKPFYDHHLYKRYLEGVMPEYRQNVVIHGAWELYNEHMAGGIHLRSALRGTEEAAELLNTIPRHAISTSFHSWQEVIELSAPYGSVFISPLFDSISKQGYKAGILPNGIMNTRTILAAQDNPCPEIIGLGGINSENISVLQKLGYEGAALLGTIWQAPHPLEAFKAIAIQ